jgi:hypothetical protein
VKQITMLDQTDATTFGTSLDETSIDAPGLRIGVGCAAAMVRSAAPQT